MKRRMLAGMLAFALVAGSVLAGSTAACASETEPGLCGQEKNQTKENSEQPGQGAVVTVTPVNSGSGAPDSVVEGACGDSANYVLNPGTGELVISGSGALSGDGPFSDYRGSIKSLKIESGITSIGSEMFSGCADLEEAELPESLTKISKEAFIGCRSLAEVKIPDTVTEIGYGAFVGCTAMTVVSVPESVELIEDFAFGYYCSNGSEGSFEKMSGMSIVGAVGSAAESYAAEQGLSFIKTTDLTGTCGENLTWTVDPDARVLTIQGVGEMEDYNASPFYELRSLIAKVDIKQGVTSIGERAMRFLNIEEVYIPDGMTKIGSAAFEYCRLLRKINLPDSITTIDSYAFYSCDRISDITLPKSLINLSYNVFDNCLSLNRILVHSENESYASDGEVLYTKDFKKLILVPGGYGGKTFRIPDTVTEIDMYAFEQNALIESVYIPASVKLINPYAFSQCKFLRNIVFEGEAPKLVIGDTEFPNTDHVKIYCNLTAPSWTTFMAGLSNADRSVWIDQSELSAAQSLQIRAEANALETKKSIQLSAVLDPQKAVEFVWSSSDTSVAIISADGKLTGIKPGRVTVTVESVDGDYTASKEFEVTGEAFSLESGTATDLADAISYTNPQVVMQQFICEDLQGMYMLYGGYLKFYSFIDGSCEEVYQYLDCKNAYMADNKLYMLGESECLVYDLLTRKITERIYLAGYRGTAVGADARGRIYIAGTETDKNYSHKIVLYNAKGEVLSETKVGTEIFSFDGFDSSNGNFYVESYYDYYSWGASHPGRGLTMGNVTGDEIRTIDTSSSFLESGLISRDLSCIEYLCQSASRLHQGSASLLGDQYLVVASALKNQVSVLDSDKAGLDILKTFSRDPIEFEQEYFSNFDTNSIGVRAVYSERQNDILIYENDKTVSAYDPATWEKVAQFGTEHYVFNMFLLGDMLVLIEKEDGAFYIEYVDVSAPERIELVPGTETMPVGTTQKLAVDAGGHEDVMCEWSSSDDQIVSVSGTGTVSAWKEGTATVTCRSKWGDCTDSIIITVTAGTALTPETNRVEADGQETDNASDNDYTVWANVVNSYLAEGADGTLTRVECADGQEVIVEEYSDQFQLSDSRRLPCELVLFGGFYSGEKYNFLVFGQDNESESDGKEVLRIVKYSKSWERLDSCSVSGANTYMPFEAGSLRMEETGGRLYVYTCHEMYKSSDGAHHQANMTYVLDEELMEVKDSYYDVLNIAQAGYVSHSFNQFIKTDGTYVYRVDHGDANPRAVSITRCPADGAVTDVTYTLPLKIQGESGRNATGVSVGGLELSGDHCLIVGNSVGQSSADSYNTAGIRNIFLTVTDKDLAANRQIWLTQYREADSVTVRTPQIVKLSDEQFLIMWEEYDSETGETRVKLMTVNGDGRRISQNVGSHMKLSDCQPIVTGDGLVKWYVTDGAKMSFYMVNPYDLTNENGNDLINHVHEYTREVLREPTCEMYGAAKYVCGACGDEREEQLEMTDHSETEVRNAREATATQDGYTGDTYCKTCGTLLAVGEVIPRGTPSGTAKPGETGKPQNPGSTARPGETGEPQNPGSTARPGETGKPQNPGSTARPGETERPQNPGSTARPGETERPQNPGSTARPVGTEKPQNPGSTARPGETEKPQNPGSTAKPGGTDGTTDGAAGSGAQNELTVQPAGKQELTGEENGGMSVAGRKFAIKSVKITPKKKLKVGKKIKITVKAAGGSGKYKYKYVYQLGKKKKKTIAKYSSKKFVYWKPKKKGTYQLTVYVKDTGTGKTMKKVIRKLVVRKK